MAGCICRAAENGKARIAAFSRYDPLLVQQEVPVRSEMAYYSKGPSFRAF
jgi:hypothetical protein